MKRLFLLASLLMLAFGLLPAQPAKLKNQFGMQ